jgi:YesN/AraC family two-component response regulator
LLVVEDNRDMQFYIRDVLGDQVAVHTAENGEEGRKMMALHKPDLIITDIMMPKMDGFEFAEWVKSQSEHMLTPIIVLSARAELEDRIKGFSIGVQDYLIKPFNPQELRVRVGNLLNFKRARVRFEEREEPEELNGDQQLLEDLRVFVSNRLDEEISVEQLAEAVHLSRRQLYRKLKSLTGFTPAQFTREIRLQQALTFLQQQKAGTISEIAHSVGFSTPGYFSRLFKERFGSSPGEYL